MQGVDEKLLSDEERRLRLVQMRRRWVIAGIIAVALVAGAFCLRPAVNAAKSWQARRKAAAAFLALKEGKLPEAREAAVGAYQLRATEPQAIRAVASFLSQSGQAQGLEFWEQLRRQAPAAMTAADRRAEAALALGLGDAERAERSVAERLAAADAGPADRLLAAQLALRKSELEKAAEFLQSVLFPEAKAADGKSTAEATPVEQLRAVVLLLSLPPAAGKTATDATAWRRLGDLAKRPDAVGLDALVLLARRALTTTASVSPGGGAAGKASPESAEGVSGFPMSEIIRALETHPLAKTQQMLLALDLQAKAEPPRAMELVERGIALCKDGDAETLLALGAWLLGKGEFARALAAIPLTRAAETRALFLQHLDALAALGRWGEIETLLQGQRFPLDPVVQEMYLARCATQLGQGSLAVKGRWQRALEGAASSGDYGKLLQLGEYAEKNDALDIAEAAYARVSAAVPRFRPAQGARLRVAQAQGDLAKMHTILREMLALWPEDTAIQNDEAYVGLLLDASTTQPAAAEALAARLVEKEPASLPHRVLLALARLKGDQAARARAIEAFANIRVEPRVATPAALAVHAAALEAAGHLAEAQEEARTVDVTMLSVPERALIDALRR